jgi:biotin carboxyl carrier protein
LKCEIELDGKLRSVELIHNGERAVWTIDGRALDADGVEVSPGIYSILIDGKSFEARVEGKSDSEFRVTVAGHEFGAALGDSRKWKRDRAAGAELEGRQQVTAPMSGKVVLVLVKTGDAVEAGQGLVVVEAMKMQNEIRSPKSGTVERLLVITGQTVNSGEVIVIVS